MHRRDELVQRHPPSRGDAPGPSSGGSYNRADARAMLHQRLDAFLDEDDANLPLAIQLFECVMQLDDFTDRIKVLRAAESVASAARDRLRLAWEARRTRPEDDDDDDDDDDDEN